MSQARRFSCHARTVMVSLACSALLLSGCSRGATNNDSTDSTPTPRVTSSAPESIRNVTTGLEVPWSITFYGETPLISERDSARVLELVPSTSGTNFEQREVARIDGVAASGEGGLLGLAVRNNYLYAYFTTRTDNRIERFTIRGKPGSLSLGRAETVLTKIPRAINHNGGRIAFGPDAKLYATVGDAGEPDLAQDRRSLAGKILRMEPDGSVPSDNPFADSLVFSYGHRNPQGIAWSADGRMFAAEFGQDTWDELNVITAGANYGWPEVEGIAKKRGFIDPVQQWPTSDASPSGIAIYNGSVFIANLRGRRLREVPLADLNSSIEHFTNKYGRLRHAVSAPDGSLWILTNNTDGRGDPQPGDDRILRFVPATQ